VSVVACHVHPKARAYVAAMLAGTAYRFVPAVSHDTPDDPTALLVTVYQPSAREHRLHSGIRQLAQWRMDGEQAPAIVCAFRSKHRLLRFPANTILREPGTSFLRLPCGRDAFCSKLEAAQPLSESEWEGVVHRACIVCGQLSSSIDRLIDVVKEGRERALDFEPLRDFAGRHFGDPIFSTLSRAESRWQKGDLAETIRVLRNAQEKAPEAAVYQIFRKLAHGREADLSNKGVGPLRAALVSMQQGLAGEEHLETRLATENWSDFKSALQEAARTLTLLQEGPYSLPDDLQRLVHTFLEQVDRLLRMTETGAVQEKPAAAVKVIDKLQDASRSILRQRPDDAE
jgi:hypothetical protein